MGWNRSRIAELDPPYAQRVVFHAALTHDMDNSP